MQRVEEDLDVPPRQRIDTTTTMGQRRRTLSVNELVYFLLAVIALADATGSVLTVIR
jgi:hypothetical protein